MAGDERAYGVARAASETDALRSPQPRAAGAEPQAADSEARSTAGAREAEASALMARYQAGDRAAFDALVTVAGPPLYRFLCHGRVADRAAADDLYQETWLRVHDARHTYRPGEPVMPWLFGVARHIALDHHRRVGRHRRRVDALEHAGDAAESVLPQRAADASARVEHGQMLSLALEGLPDKQREALFLLKIEGLSVKEAAEIAGTSQGALKVRAHRAYAQVRARLAQLLGESPSE